MLTENAQVQNIHVHVISSDICPSS